MDLHQAVSRAGRSCGFWAGYPSAQPAFFLQPGGEVFGESGVTGGIGVDLIGFERFFAEDF